MHLTPREIEKLMLHNVGFLAQKRLARGARLNQPESVALIACQLLELIRDGQSVAVLMDLGRQLLGRRHVLPGVAELVPEVQVEGTFPDGTKLVTVHQPICSEDGNLELALYGSFLPAPKPEAFPPIESEDAPDDCDVPGAFAVADGTIALNEGREAASLKVTNTGDRPVQVGSHYHFVEVNRALRFDRGQAYGMRLDIPAGTAVRFEPGDTKTVSLVSIAGRQVIRGGNNLADGAVSDDGKAQTLTRVADRGFENEEG